VIHVLGEVAIGDLQTFLAVFTTAGAEARKRHGCQGADVYAVEGDESQVRVLLTWESREAFDGFAGDASVRETMRSGGMQGPPRFTVLTKVAGLPH
jgi:quinol monooxygenase YgiN